jgi:hypothetical protein
MTSLVPEVHAVRLPAAVGARTRDALVSINHEMAALLGVACSADAWRDEWISLPVDTFRESMMLWRAAAPAR